jgi:tetratricopeptide (TPR) repeat protein
MERTRFKLIIFILFITSFPLTAGYRSEIYTAYIDNKMERWKNVIDHLDAIPEKNNGLLLELVNYQYGYIGYCIGFDRKDEARRYLGIAQRNLDILEERNYNLSVINAYKSAFYGFRIALKPISAPVNGLRSIECARTALKLDPDYYFGYVQHGNIQFYMPAAFGGSKKEALQFYLKAKELIEKDPESVSENWNYLSLLIVIAQTYIYMKDYSSAQKVYEKILKIEPGFLYVKDDLYPKLLEKMES